MESATGVDIEVSGFTAVGIDVSDRLGMPCRRTSPSSSGCR